MWRSAFCLAACLAFSAAVPAVAQTEGAVYDVTATGLRGQFDLTFEFVGTGQTTGLQIGSLVITSVDTETPTLPSLEGTWLSLNLSSFSVFSVNQVSSAGRATVSGVTIGDQLIGVMTTSRFTDSVNGTFILRGEAAAEVPETPTDPGTELPVTATTASRRR